MKTVNYAKLDYDQRRSWQRYAKRVEKQEIRLLCQECRGYGYWVEPVLEDGSGPEYSCDLCRGTGLLTPYLRGLWLQWKRGEPEESDGN
jgi:hypothetical protein